MIRKIYNRIFDNYFSTGLKQNTIIWFFRVYTIVIILLCVLPINSSDSSLNNTYLISIRLDYLAHFILFIPWMFLLKKYSNVSFYKNTLKATLLIIIGLLFAFGLEFIQYYLPYRAFNINDLIANGIGIAIGTIFFIR